MKQPPLSEPMDDHMIFLLIDLFTSQWHYLQIIIPKM